MTAVLGPVKLYLAHLGPVPQNADAIAQDGCTLEFLAIDGAAKLVLELFEFGHGAVLLHLREQFPKSQQ